MTVQEALEAIYERNGQLTAELVLKEASDQDSAGYEVLHAFFTWDDGDAGNRWRLSQARMLIRRCRIRVETSPERNVQVRAFTHVPSAAAFAPTRTVLSGEYREEVLARLRADIAALRRKYEALVDFDAVLAGELGERGVVA